MKITIDNLDGAGAIDYSAALSADGPLQIERVLNAPSRCSGMLDVSDVALAVPVRRGRVVVTADSGVVLFTGYLATEPEQIYAGTGTMGPVYRVAFSAISDEWLLDKQAIPLSGAAFGQSGGQVLTTLTNRVDSGLLTTTGVTAGQGCWSVSAGADGELVAECGERRSSDVLGLSSAGWCGVDAICWCGDSCLERWRWDAADRSAEDCGSERVGQRCDRERRDGADGIHQLRRLRAMGRRTVFQLTEAPFKPKAMANSSLLLTDSFNEATFNTRIWNVSDPGSHLGLGAGGLQMSGGTGLDGQTTLTAIDAVEMGGTLVIEAGGLVLDAASAGIVCGLYSGATQSSNCFAGYNVRQSGGSTVIVPLVNGAEVGTVYALLSGHVYTLRIRLHCVEMQRVLQAYYAMVDGVVESFGGGLVSAPMAVVFELQDLGDASNTPATVLYDGSVLSSPASCSFVAVNSLQMTGSMEYCPCIADGIGVGREHAAERGQDDAVDWRRRRRCRLKVSATGKVTFLAGRIPVAGETVSVTYRGRLRSVARLENAASVAAEAAGGMPGSAIWAGSVLRPAARSSVDCESAALAVLSFAGSRAAAVAGTYEAVNPADVWPGDVLALTSNAVDYECHGAEGGCA